MRRDRLVHAGIVLLALLPAAALVVGAWRDTLGANPIEAITHETGIWALRLLLAALAVTPLRRLFGWRRLAPYRRTFGLLAFGYACLHLAAYVVLDLFFDWSAVLEDVAKRLYITAGFSAFVLLVPLAVTSTRRFMRRLGHRWVQLHRLVYAAALLAVVHFIWQTKADYREPLVYAAVLALLLAARLWRLATASSTSRPADR